MSNSMSTEKLEIISGIIFRLKESLPEEKLACLKSVDINWSTQGEDDDCVICPSLHLEFFD